MWFPIFAYRISWDNNGVIGETWFLMPISSLTASWWRHCHGCWCDICITQKRSFCNRWLTQIYLVQGLCALHSDVIHAWSYVVHMLLAVNPTNISSWSDVEFLDGSFVFFLNILRSFSENFVSSPWMYTTSSSLNSFDNYVIILFQ